MASKNSSRRFFESLWRRTFRPHASVTEYNEIRRAQLVMAFSLLISVTSTIGLITSSAHGQGIMASVISLIALAACGLASYILARSPYYKFGAYLLIWGFAISGFWLTINRPDDPTGALFSTIPIAIILGSVLLSVRGQALVTILCVLGTALLPRFFPEFTKMERNSGLFLTMGSLLLVITIFRNTLERARLSEVRESNASLKLIRANLEGQVIERTAATEAARLQAEAARREAEAARREVEAQMWLATGQAQLAEKMRGEQEVAELARNAITQLCQYTEAQAGALFLLENKTLTLAGSYAYQTRSETEVTFPLGTGLIGQAALEPEPIRLEKIPPETLVISTGLIDMVPKELLLASFRVNQEVVGVVELATLNGFKPTHLEFLARISESLGIAFRTAQARLKVANLLSETQTQAEELQAQEEELRAANEELQAQAENLRLIKKSGERN
jgi:hypothetical protein